MKHKTKVQFKTGAGKVVRFTARSAGRAARYGSNKIRDYSKQYVPYKSYKTPAQRKAASTAKVRTVRATSSKTKGMWARCPICHRLQAVRTTSEKNAWLAAHVKHYH